MYSIIYECYKCLCECKLQQSPNARMHSLEFEGHLVDTLLELFAAQYRIQPLIRAALYAIQYCTTSLMYFMMI